MRRSFELLGTPGRAFRAALDAARLDMIPGGAGAATGDGEPGGSRERGTGGSAHGIPVNGTIGFGGPAAGAEAALQALEAGFTTLKLKAGAERETVDLVARVRAIRPAVGPDVRLRLDVNGAWDLPTAEERLEAVARFGIEYVEQPLPADDSAGAADLRRRVDVPVAADEAAASLVAVRRLLAEGAADVLVVKPARVGGPLAVAEIAEAAAARGVPVVLSTLFETGIGIASALVAAARLPRVVAAQFPAPLAHGLATAGLLDHDLLDEPLVIDSGHMHAPGGAGTGRLGIRVDRGAVSRIHGRVRRGGPMSAPLLLPLALRRHARATPDAMAIAEPGRAWSFAALDALADALAVGLVASGVGPGDRVALVAAPSATAIALLVATARVGAYAAPLGTRLAARRRWAPRAARSCRAWRSTMANAPIGRDAGRSDRAPRCPGRAARGRSPRGERGRSGRVQRVRR